MYQTSPGVERAVTQARAAAGGADPTLAHLLLALLNDDEGRPALLVEQAGYAVAGLRAAVEAAGPGPTPAENHLFSAAREWSIAFRADPEFLSDALLLAAVRYDARFAAATGLDPARLEAVLRADPNSPVGDAPPPAPTPTPVVPVAPPPSSAGFALPDVAPDPSAVRILDANFNRAREGLRVLDDYCRFALDDPFLTGQVKELRHALAAAAGLLPPGLLLAHRDTPHDVGTAVTAAGEYDRRTPAQVAEVNLKRLQEACRSLEEYGKLFGPQVGRELEAVRYRAYTLERAVVGGATPRARLAAARLYVLLTGANCTAALDWTIQQAAAGGATVFQLREKGLTDRELLARARDVRRWTRRAGVLFVVNDRPDIARLADADGVHLGQDDLNVADARRLVGADALVGVSTHTVDQVRRAVLDGADYLGVGPVFASQTKAFDAFPGPALVAAAAAETSLPHFALGGVTAATLGDVVRAGGTRVAVGAAVCAADDPEAAARTLLAGLTG